MNLGKTRYVAACQQLLALGVVVAALVPAAGVITLDVVRETPVGSTAVAPQPSGALAAYTRAALAPSEVAAAPTDAQVTEVQLTAPDAALAGRRVLGATPAPRLQAREATTAKSTVITSTPQAVTGFGTVGVTWEHGDALDPSQIRVELRTATDGTWSGWKKLDYDVDGPNADTAEGKRSRPGTMEALVGHVDQVQVQMTITGAEVPADMKLAVIAPGQAPMIQARAAIDTADLDPAADEAGAVDAPLPTATQPGRGSASSGEEQVALSAASIVTPKPQIYSRAQWGADERVREQTSPGYAEVHGGFVHHTVNANDYTAAEVPGILRSIYAYHVKSRGWRDIGYNFLIDKFGRIWEGRYGGVDRPVVGAHTENYNDYGFGVSAIGNFETAKPTDAMIQAEGALFAWKLSLHGVSAAATNVKIGARTFASSIMGHRDTKATACPGKYLYARIPDIRTLAASLQQGWSGRALQSGHLGTAEPDLVVRNATTKEVYVLPINDAGGVPSLPPVPTAPATAGRAQTVVSADLNGDGRADLVKVNRAGRMTLKAGDGLGHYTKVVVRNRRAFVGRSLLTSAGDLNGDHRNDLVARIDSGKSAGKLALYLGRGNGTFKRVARPVRLAGAVQILAGDRTGDGKADLVIRTAGAATLYRGTGTGRFAAGTPYVASSAGRVGTPIDTGLNLPQATDLLNAGDWNRDGNADLISRNTDGNLYLYLGNGQGRFAAATLLAKGFGGVSLLSAGGDITGDGYPDLQAQINGAMRIYPGRGTAGLAASYVSHSAIAGKKQIAVGLWTSDGAPDAIFLNAKSTVLYPGNGPGGLTNPITIGAGLMGYSWVVGISDAGRSALIARDAAGSLYRIDPTSSLMLGTPQLLATGFGGYDLAG